MITKIKWKNHPVLGNLSLNLLNASNQPYKNIVLAGENGCGKTTILETLSDFLNFKSAVPFDYIEYIDGSSTYIATTTNPNVPSNYYIYQNLVNGNYFLLDPRTNSYQDVNPFDKSSPYRNLILQTKGSIYSKARSGFKTENIDSVKTSELDKNKHDADSSDDFTPVKQLLIDISAQDSEEWREYSEAHRCYDYVLYEPNLKLYKFKQAFNSFFGNIKFKKIEIENGAIKVKFTKNGRDVDIESLSTGEQQIVFRGTQLLRNSNVIAGGAVLIDEPELSMHPKWQTRIFDYYRNLFKVGGNQTVQMFFATHSGAVIKSALQDPDTLVIALSETGGTIHANHIKSPTDTVLPNITASEINYLAFDIPSIDYHIALFGYLQSRFGLDKIKDVDNYILAQPQYVPSIHHKPSHYTDRRTGRTRHYETLPVLVRNRIDHPDTAMPYTDAEFIESIKLLIELCR